MSGKRKNLQDAQAESDPNLDFTYNELLEELAAAVKYEERKPGDVSVADLADRTGLSENSCRVRLGGLVRAGKLVRVMVRGVHGPYPVYRKNTTTAG